MRSGVIERSGGPSVSVRVGDRGYRSAYFGSGYHGSSYYGYGPSYSYYGYGPAYGYTSYSYGPAYGYRSVGVRARVDFDDDDCD
mgnify:CR=1 FL=1